VAVVAQWFPTVSETFVLNQVTGLIDLGYAVDVYAWGPEALEEFGHRQLGDYRLDDVIRYLPEELDRKELTRQFRIRDYCAVHCHFGFVAEKIAFLKRELKHVPFVVTFHGKDIRKAQDEGWEVLQSTFRNFDRFVAICGYNRSQLEQLGCPAGKIVDLPNGVDTDLFSPGNRRSSRVTRIATVARLHWVKNIPFALQVMHRLAQSGLEFHYDVIGHGRERPQIESLVDELGLSNRVKLHGQCSQHEVAALLKRSDLFFLPSRNEASPVCILEAQASGLPVVATRVGGIPELVTDGLNGYVVDSDDEKAAARRILALATNDEMRLAMGTNGRKKAIQNHDFGMLIRKCASLYGMSASPA
jgi:colanic acid/amylovoran biosynthesis glycosyltransferase